MVDRGSAEGLGLAEAIESLRDDLLQARAAGATSEIQLPVESMTVELTVSPLGRSMAGRGSRCQSWRWSWAEVGAGSAAPGRR